MTSYPEHHSLMARVADWWRGQRQRRAAMDELVGRRLAENITGPQVKELKALVDAMEKAVKAEDPQAYHLLNLSFHDRMVEMAGNRKLTEIYRKLIKELSLFRRLNLADGWLMPMSANEHRLIVKAIASGDADAAGRAMFQHVIESKERTIENDLRRQAGQADAAGAGAEKAAVGKPVPVKLVSSTTAARKGKDKNKEGPSRGKH